jgi:hypothetical protein
MNPMSLTEMRKLLVGDIFYSNVLIGYNIYKLQITEVLDNYHFEVNQLNYPWLENNKTWELGLHDSFLSPVDAFCNILRGHL